MKNKPARWLLVAGLCGAGLASLNARAEPAGAPVVAAVVLTPQPAPQPRINGARVVGVRPGHPVLYAIAATGDRPMTFRAAGLPAGLKLDANTGLITGATPARGTFKVRVQARNVRGVARRELRIEVGDRIALTPPMGWNSWNCFAGAVTAEKVKAAADAMCQSGLSQHGWQYINIDDFWQVHRDSRDPTLQGPHRDAQGRILPNPRFPDMPGLTAYIHRLGLKAGLYSSPGPWTCGGCVASWQHEARDAQSYAEWGFDYLKYDWCSYDEIAPRGKKRSLDDLKKPYLVMRDALRQQPRDIVFSLCQYGLGQVWEWGEAVGGNCWRTTGDITDTWESLSEIGFSQAGQKAFAGPGHWNDPDMLIVGQVGWGPQLHPTRLTPDEQYTHISLWCLLCAPLLIGCDMTQLDDFTRGLLTNDEVLEVNQDPRGEPAGRVAKTGEWEVWAKHMEDGSRAAGLFNRGAQAARVTAQWSDLGLSGRQRVRDLWRQRDVGIFEGQFATVVPGHGVALLRISSAD